jgi:hypothetical protein
MPDYDISRKDEYIAFLNEGIRLGERRGEDLWRPRVWRAYAVGILIGAAVGVVVYIEIVSTINAS